MGTGANRLNQQTHTGFKPISGVVNSSTQRRGDAKTLEEREEEGIAKSQFLLRLGVFALELVLLHACEQPLSE